MSIVGDVDEHSAAGNTLSQPTSIGDNFNLVSNSKVFAGRTNWRTSRLEAQAAGLRCFSHKSR